MVESLRSGEKGQALLEFALLITILLTFLFVIIEAGRIFQAWVTVQNSARSAARYALTGQYNDTGVFDTPECPPGTPSTQWQVCAVKDEALRTAAGLNINPAAGPTEPRAFGSHIFYNVEIESTGELTTTEGVAPPGESTRVQVYYNVEVLTPFFRVIADNIRVKGQVEVVTENYDQITPGEIGSTVTNNPPSPPLPTEADIVVQKRGPTGLVLVGEIVTYHIDVLNTGDSGVPNVTVVDMLPPETVAVHGWTVTSGVSPVDLATCVVDTGVWEIDCVIPFLVSGQLATVNVDLVLSPSVFNTTEINKNTVNVTNTVEVFNQTKTIDPDLTNNKSFTETQVLAWADLKLVKNLKFFQPDPVSLGEEVVFLITVRNEGPNVGSDAEVSDIIPAGLSLISADSSESTDCIDAGNVINCPLDPIGPSDTPVITVTTMATAVGTITNTASVSDSHRELGGYDPDQTDDSSIQVLATNLIITKTASSESVLSGEPITYTIEVLNGGPGLATFVTFTDTMSFDPLKVSLDPIWSISPGCIPVGIPPQFSCVLTDALTSDKPPIVFTFVVTPTLEDGVMNSNINNIGIVSSNKGLVTAANGVDVDVVREFHLDITKSAPSEIYVSEIIPYTITVTNNGPSTAHNFVIEDRFVTDIPSGNLNEPNPNCDSGLLNTFSDGFTCTVPELNPSDNIVLTFDVTPSSDGSITNSATVTDTFETNNIDVTTVVLPVADLKLTPVLPPQKVTGTITYTFNIENLGPSAATNITVTDIITGNISAITITNDSGICGSASDSITSTTTILTCLITDTIPAGGGESFIVAFSYYTAALTIDNYVEVRSETFDPISNNAYQEKIDLSIIDLSGVDTQHISHSIEPNIRTRLNLLA